VSARRGLVAHVVRALSGSLVLACAVGASSAALAATYKWVDDKGVVHYSDQMPTDALNKGSVVLDKNAIPIRRTDPALTAEQRRAKAEQDARAEQQAKEREAVDRRDRALLSTYTTENEIELARNRALSTIDAQVQSSTAYSATLGKRRDQLEKRKAELGENPMPPALEREWQNINAELAKQDDLLAVKRKEILVVNARYDADKKRWRELRANTEAQANGTAPVLPTSTQAPAK
jgi:hypothetical protein